jgi:hypothetical protein
MFDFFNVVFLIRISDCILRDSLALKNRSARLRRVPARPIRVHQRFSIEAQHANRTGTRQKRTPRVAAHREKRIPERWALDIES